jgi:hypothetical protein
MRMYSSLPSDRMTAPEEYNMLKVPDVDRFRLEPIVDVVTSFEDTLLGGHGR